jgi:hypothetical protein
MPLILSLGDQDGLQNQHQYPTNGQSSMNVIEELDPFYKPRKILKIRFVKGEKNKGYQQ